MIKRKLLFTTTMLLLAALHCQAQITGTVKDELDEPIFNASVMWLGTTSGTVTDADGHFKIEKPANSNKLVIRFVGYITDTLTINSTKQDITVKMRETVYTLNNVVVRDTHIGKSQISLFNSDQISAAQLTRAACCNLGESFTSNASVDVNYSDAASGAKQIKLLGLSGTYVQMMTENIPNYRGAAMPYALGYIPGPWMQSIQVSKGTSSVKNGYEAITGQINVEFKKPQAEESVNANLYYSSKNKFEANFDVNKYLGKRWKMGVLAHYENYTKSDDMNHDGFQDMPKIEQYNFQNRWAWMGDNYVFQASIKGMHEERRSGQNTLPSSSLAQDLYKIGINTNRYEAFTKNAYIFNKEKNSNVALILSGSLHNEDTYYGSKSYNKYDVDQSNVYACLMFETEMNSRNSISVGLSANYDHYKQDALLQKAGIANLNAIEKEFTPGAYAQYTYNLDDKLVLMGGLRYDHSSIYGSFVTPRAHIKWMPSSIFSLRGTVGKGYRTNHIMAENHFYLASSRNIIIDANLQQEEAWNYGLSTVLDIPLGERNLNLSAEYYYTNFEKQTVVDLDTDAHAVHFSNLDGHSYSHTFQVEAVCPLFTGFELTAAYRLTDVRQTINGKLSTRPLTPKNKGVFSAQYKTPLGIWQFDATLQLNGGGRMPTPDAANPLWEARYKGYEQVSAQVTRWFRNFSIYIGGENLTGFHQKNPFIAANDPWGKNFDSTMCWGPVEGAMFYAGIRFNFIKY